jgi:hypothetical protein
MRVEAVLVNRMLRRPLLDAERLELERLSTSETAVCSALWLDARARMQHRQLARLRRTLPRGTACWTLPLDAGLDMREQRGQAIDRLAQTLGRRLW